MLLSDSKLSKAWTVETSHLEKRQSFEMKILRIVECYILLDT
jgi:hypothetical protein